MYIILSPARNTALRPFPGVQQQEPLFLREAAEIVETLKTYNAWELESLLDVNPDRAFELQVDFQRFSVDIPGEPALTSYSGAAYRNMSPGDFTTEGFAFAQEHLRILSALYGLLRPADGILPHRLGIKREFTIDGHNLYAFWGDKLYQALYENGGIVINLASLDYAKFILPHMKPGDEMIHCRFLQRKPDGIRSTVATVRAARGQMTRFIVKNRITSPEGIKDFDWDGYRFIPNSSDPVNFVFVREQNV